MESKMPPDTLRRRVQGSEIPPDQSGTSASRLMDSQFEEDQRESEESIRSKYIVFTLDGELYGVLLLQIREVIKMTPIKPVPHTQEWLKGVINLRGRIITVMDLRTKFGIHSRMEVGGLILIAESDHGFAGAVVDTIEFVREIPDSDIEPHPGIDTRIPREQFRGIAKLGDKLIHLLDIAKIVADLRGESNPIPENQYNSSFKESA